MLRTLYVLAPAVAICLAGCARNVPETSTTDESRMDAGTRDDRQSSVRFNEEIRAACNDSQGAAFFPFDSASLTDEATRRLDALAECLTSGGLQDRQLRVVGYTDPRGSAGYNQDLGRERADSVASYLRNKGVPSERMVVESRGEQGASPDPADWAWDRMVDLDLVPRS